MSDTSSIPGVQGASRQSWKDSNPRPLLRHVMDSARDPHNREAVMEAFFDLTNDEMHRVMQEYWFDLNYNRFVAQYPKPGQTREQHQAERETAKQAVAEEVASNAETIKTVFEAKVEEKAKRLLLDVMMPNQKKLRDCTCGECREMGGWLAALASKGQPEQYIGEIADESDVRALAPANFA